MSGPEQIYTALSRIKSYDYLFCTLKICNKSGASEREWFIFHNKKKKFLSDDTITVFVQNIRSFSKHVEDIVSDDRIINNEIIAFVETQWNPSDSAGKLLEFFLILDQYKWKHIFKSSLPMRNNIAI